MDERCESERACVFPGPLCLQHFRMLTEPEIFERYSATKQIEDLFNREVGREDNPLEGAVLLPIYGKKVVDGKYQARA